DLPSRLPSRCQARVREAADFYDLERPGLGAEFLDAVEGTMRRVIAHPESSPVVLGQVRSRVPGGPRRFVSLLLSHW
ncbi:MAG: hypothetical protein ACYCX3_07180, partial [Thermoleophilia bacterium]